MTDIELLDMLYRAFRSWLDSGNYSIGNYHKFKQQIYDQYTLEWEFDHKSNITYKFHSDEGRTLFVLSWS